MLELREPPRTLREVVYKQRGPLRSDDFRTRGDRAGSRLVHGVHGAHRYTDCSPVLPRRPSLLTVPGTVKKRFVENEWTNAPPARASALTVPGTVKAL